MFFTNQTITKPKAVARQIKKISSFFKCHTFEKLVLRRGNEFADTQKAIIAPIKT